MMRHIMKKKEYGEAFKDTMKCYVWALSGVTRVAQAPSIY
jgi:hypothetical protein